MKKKFLAAVATLAPLSAFAADAGFESVDSAITTITNLIGRLVPLVISLGLVLFLIGVLKFITAGGDEEKRASARGMIIFGIIALFVMTAVWGLVNILKTTIFSNDTDVYVAPGIPIPPDSSSFN